jgi:hypothetical protein
MTEVTPDPITPDTRTEEQRAAAAKQRFIALSLFRFSGVALVMFGFLLIRERFDFVQGDKAKIMGSIFAFVGLFQALIIPRILSLAWVSPRS